MEYYAVDYKWKEQPSVGAVKKDDKGFFIEKEDTYSDTRIDDSEKSNEILKYCGWV